MSAAEGIRKLLRDVVAPEVREMREEVAVSRRVIEREVCEILHEIRKNSVETGERLASVETRTDEKRKDRGSFIFPYLKEDY